DHLKVHDVSVVAFERAADPAAYPEMGAPHVTSKLYYSAWSIERLKRVHEALLAKHGESPFDENWFSRPSQDERITTRVNVSSYMWARTGALRAHATQVDPAALFWFGLNDDELATVYPSEDWILAQNRCGPISHQETSLFDGLAQVVSET
ncbi:MAG: mycothiol conjugate amidase Mca, partial [Actinomycetota bacterium]|nr:mycothiol conjugate amidase Mca [Actinomycetota bacterium]